MEESFFQGPAINRNILAVFVLLAAICAAQDGFAFGTVRGLGQNAEHERITRHALGCGLLALGCFEPQSLTELAGAKDNFGAVGIPDRGELVPANKAHCDGGDYFDLPGYPHGKAAAQAALEACRAWMIEKLQEAVRDSGGLIDGSGKLRKSEVAVPCLFVGQMKGRAKCNAIEDFGILLHASQDFYSHSNWVDQPDSTRPVGIENPPGLGNAGPAPWIGLREPVAFPDGLISGCFDNVPEDTHCNYGPGKLLHRLKHAVLNKDDGTIDPEIGAGTTQRGAIDGNFARAVEAAIADTRDKWALLKEKLAETYGAGQGALMACAISHDEPMKDCQ